MEVWNITKDYGLKYWKICLQYIQIQKAYEKTEKKIRIINILVNVTIESKIESYSNVLDSLFSKCSVKNERNDNI